MNIRYPIYEGVYRILTLLRLRGKRLPMGNNGSGRKSGGGGQIPEGGYRMQRYGASDGDSG